ncbi:MAG TPA: glycosyltransferase family 39 protein [Rhizobiaceae bacterium]|nr:glycosyltransferase family 39 protein [Rhizobiaceae bacterium]
MLDRNNAGRATALWISAALILVFAAWYWMLLPVGEIRHGDEILTLDRSSSFAARGDYLTVYTSNVPDFRKPPLQYWMTAGLLSRGADLEFSLRFPSWLFSMLSLAATGWLAVQISPRQAFVAPAAILLAASSTTFWVSATSGLLDSGAMFFGAVTVAACFAALREPRWWYAAALAIGVGSLQKAPVPLAFAAAIALGALFTAKSSGIDVRRAFMNRHFALSLGLMLAVLLAWPVLQLTRYGTAFIQVAYIDQMVNRFSPVGTQEGFDRRSWYTILTSGEPLLRIPAMAALFALPVMMRRSELWALPALLSIFALMAAMGSGYVSPRYSLLFLPMLAAALAAVTLDLFAARPRHGMVAIAVLSALSLGPLKTSDMLDLNDTQKVRANAILMEVASKLAPGETLVTCRGSRDGLRIYAGAASYYASRGRPFVQVRNMQELALFQQQGLASPPYRGACHASAGDEIKAAFGPDAIVGEVDGFVHWQASTAAR